MTKIISRNRNHNKFFKHGSFGYIASALSVTGFIVFLVAFIGGTKSEKILWCLVGMAMIVLGWLIERYSTNSAGEAIAQLFADIFLNPFNRS